MYCALHMLDMGLCSAAVNVSSTVWLVRQELFSEYIARPLYMLSSYSPHKLVYLSIKTGCYVSKYSRQI